MPAYEITLPKPPEPPANDSRFAQRLRVFDMQYLLRNGHAGVITTVARNSTVAVDHLDSIFGEALKGVRPCLVL